jgi:hypothetical protein
MNAAEVLGLEDETEDEATLPAPSAANEA